LDPLGLFDPDATAGSSSSSSGGASGAALLDRRWLVTSEVMHGRWAMLAALGCLAPEVLGRGLWWQQLGSWAAAGEAAAAAAAAGSSRSSGGDAADAAAAALLLLAAAEGARWADFVRPGCMAQPLQALLPRTPHLSGAFAGSGVAAYPGGPLFDCLGLGGEPVASPSSSSSSGSGSVGSSRRSSSSSSRSGLDGSLAAIAAAVAAAAPLKDAELKHGRLAMLALLGFAAQAVVTGQGPWANLLTHLESPVQHNALSYIGAGLDGLDAPDGADAPAGGLLGDAGDAAAPPLRGEGRSPAPRAPQPMHQPGRRPYPGGGAGLSADVARLHWTERAPVSGLMAAAAAAGAGAGAAGAE
jgi:light-harvesting complex I chlorophyll a/b binding protein 3